MVKVKNTEKHSGDKTVKDFFSFTLQLTSFPTVLVNSGAFIDKRGDYIWEESKLGAG